MARHRVVYCTHCGKPQQGSAGVHVNSAFHPLCHPDPDDAMDCYRLVTVYQHQLVDCPCAMTTTPDHTELAPW